MSKKRTNLTLAKSTVNFLERLSKESGKSQSHLIDYIVDKYKSENDKNNINFWIAQKKELIRKLADVDDMLNQLRKEQG